MSMGKLDDDVAAPRLTGNDWPIEPSACQHLEERCEVTRHRRHVIATLRFGRLTMTALVNRYDSMPSLSERSRGTLPQQRVRRESMDQHDRGLLVGRHRLPLKNPQRQTVHVNVGTARVIDHYVPHTTLDVDDSQCPAHHA
jgi:hypothetical protein